MKNLLLILFFASTSFASSHEKTELDIKTTTPPQEQLFFDDSKKLKRPDLLLFLNENPQKNDNLNFVLKCVNLLSDEDTCGQEFLYELFSYPKFTKLGCINQLLSGDFLNAYIGKKFYWALLRLDPGNEHEKKQTEKAFHKFQERFKEKSTLTLGHTNAQLYYDYASYLYTIQSLNRAIFWMDQSLDMGNIRALKQLGIFYFDRSTYVKEQGLEKSCNDLLSSLFYYKKAIYEAQEDTFSSVLSCFEQLLALSPTVSSCLEESAESTKESLDLLEFYKNSDRLSPYYRKNLDLHYHHRKKVNASLLKLKVKFTQSAYQHLLKVFNFEKDATLKAEGIDDMFWTLSFFAQYFLLYQRDDSLSLENEQILKTAKKYVKVCWKNRETLTTLGGYEYYLLGHYFFHHESENKSLFFFKKSCNYNLALAHHHILMHSLYEKDSVAYKEHTKSLIKLASSDKDGSNDPKAQFLLATLYETVWSDQKNSFIKSFNFYQLSLNNKENNTFSKRTFQAILAIYKNLDKETLNNQSMGLKEIAAKFYAVLKSEKRSCFIKEFNQDVLEVLKNLEELKTQVNLKESLGFPINNDYERGWFEELVGNKETAKEFYQKSIDVNDDVPSLYNLANLLYNDKTDDTRCIKLLIRAFEKKDLRCLSILCSMYYEKRFVTNNPEMFLIPLSIDYSDKQKEELLFDPLDLR